MKAQVLTCLQLLTRGYLAKISVGNISVEAGEVTKRQSRSPFYLNEERHSLHTQVGVLRSSLQDSLWAVIPDITQVYRGSIVEHHGNTVNVHLPTKLLVVVVVMLLG